MTNGADDVTEASNGNTPLGIASTEGLDALLEAMAVEAFRRGGQGKLAVELGVSAAFMSAMMNRKKVVPDEIARRFGFARKVEVSYVRTTSV